MDERNPFLEIKPRREEEATGPTTSRPRAAVGAMSEIFDRPIEWYQEATLSLRNVTVTFGGVAALSKVAFDVAPGELAGVVGPNGAGKSTLLNAISGLVPSKVGGSIELAGRELLGRRSFAMAREGVARSFQDPPLIDDESVLENVLLGEHVRLGYRMGDQIWRRRRVLAMEAIARHRADTVIDFLNLTEVRDRQVAGLAYGVRKLIDIARAIVSGPRLLLLDEPTSGLDSDEQQAVARVMAELQQATPVTTLAVEHHMDIVRAISTKVIGMQAGSILAAGSPTEVLDSPQFRTALVGGNVAESAEMPRTTDTAGSAG
jgi:branched-chain amino acid transport system ATP-binding protein